MPISISQFAADKNLLNTPLWPKQSEILEEFWQGNYAIAIWSLGRRSGKTTMASVTATYAGTTLAEEYKKHLRPGERFFIVSVANSDNQAKIALQGVKDLINNSPILKPLVVRETSDTLELSNGAVFRALPASSRSGRGLACPLLIFDELAHAVDSDGNAAGGSLYQALSPSVAQFGKLGKILMLSSPWTQAGIFWDIFKQGSSGQFSHIQTVQAATWQVNPNVSKDFLEQEKARDPELFRVEYGAEFSQSLSSFLDPALVDAAVNCDRTSLRPIQRYRGQYVLSLDPARGGRDAYTACIAHFEAERLVVDLFYEFKTAYLEGKKYQISIEQVESWIEEYHKLYQFNKVVMDQYNSQGTIQKLKNTVPIEEITWSVKTKTQAFSKMRELFNSGNIDLYFHEKAIQQLKNLIVTYRSGGTWNVSGGNAANVDDHVSALAGAILVLSQNTSSYPAWIKMI